jgi:hypothetical protein
MFAFVFLCEVLCDPLCFNDLILNTKDTKVNTKAHKGLFQQPHRIKKPALPDRLLSIVIRKF